MKKVTLITVGRLKEKFFADAAAEYTKRVGRFCELKLIQLDDCATPDAIKRESDAIFSAILANCGSQKNFWLLDKDGESLTSERLAAAIDREFISAPLTLVIGGSSGVNDEIKQKAARKISFGAMTYPHQLMRIMLLEQLYRAFTITAGMPYHK